MATKTLSDFGIPKDGEDFEKESLPLSHFKIGTIMNVIGFEFKNLGKNPGIVFELEQPVTDKNEGKNWTKVHTSNKITIKTFRERVNLEKGDVLKTELVSGKTENGTWYDLQ